MKEETTPQVPTCRVCGCTDNDCRQCIKATGVPCYWVEPGLCSACSGKPYPAAVNCIFTFGKDTKELSMKFDTDLMAGDEPAEAERKIRAALKELQWEEACIVSIAFTKSQPKPEQEPANPLQNWERVEDPEQYTDFEEVE